MTERPSLQPNALRDVPTVNTAKAPDTPVAIVCNPLYAIGGLGLVAGILLWLGNLSGLVPTFRGSGLVAIAVGCVFWHLGVCFPRRVKL